MYPKARFVFLATGAGILGYAIAGFATGMILGSIGPQHPHGPTALLIAFLGAIYFAPAGGILALIFGLVLKERTAKKLAIILSVAFVVLVVALLLYFKLQR